MIMHDEQDVPITSCNNYMIQDKLAQLKALLNLGAKQLAVGN